MIYRKVIKRLLDIAASSAAIVLLSPLLAVIGILVRVKLGSPVIFSQVRPGYKGKLFRLRKFRTMTDERDEKGELKSDEERLTPFGKTLRSTSLDELPEFFNILKGEMSFVGPRPLLVQYLPLYNARQRKRHDVLPGLTGLAQVNGRNAITWEQKFEYDVEYVEKLSFLLDLKIVIATIGKVFAREGISAEGSATMDYFRGSQDSSDSAGAGTGAPDGKGRKKKKVSKETR